MKTLCLAFILYAAFLLSGLAQTLQIQNWTGANFQDGEGFFNFPPGVTTVTITFPFRASWNNSGMYQTLGFYLPATNDVVLIIPANYEYTYNDYAEGTLSGVASSGVLSASFTASLLTVIADPSVQTAYNYGLVFGLTMWLGLFGFTFIRSIPGGGKEDM